ncbi:Brp/Blh family beta-carotene 15,15'-dioxygenase [Flavobacterium sp.]|uniref:Brp/Blh family beta-carotene 15,15'-dioxygenase n=1 Tax=Flavobacterium sp. TaxID=239 RepID=UPI003751C21B
MLKIQKISILSSFIGLWLTSFLNQDVQFFVGFLLILSFGILHGANDLVLINQLNIASKPKSFLKLLVSYVVIVLTAVILFVVVPSLAMLLFIIISSYHFGEQHWQKLKEEQPNAITILFQLNYGLFILFLLFVFHTNEVIDIVYKITNMYISELFINIVFSISTFLLIVLMLFIANKTEAFKKNIPEQLLYILVFAIIFKVGSLIWAFTIYFILWHSIPSLNDQIKFLYGSYSFKNFIIYFKSAFLYWIISLIGIAILYYFFKDQKLFEALFFSFLAAITFPHAWVILKMFKNKA